ncbi:acyl-CoA dehydrogenase [Amycolatopsis xylanica]|uniref:Acyl-CoA dehydrogenase n=1 Tax=Amycolatopsis xylanica TaxID=589385 RepID=A0A1H3SBQ1_9PSEU|nr:acyl-CoA dehydrogenase family protein [Amycolatopsis xylanica]SDZ35523.1 acyl-CoA dehydrogenase [Amycolatopsis xylanica]
MGDRAEKLAAAYQAARTTLPVLEQHAATTDHSSEFPVKAVDELRAAGLMGLLVPVEHGGAGGDLGDLVAVAGLLATKCVSTALIWAMHCQQVDCVVRFGPERLCADLLPRIAAGDVYLASVTTEAGKGGYLFSSEAPVVSAGDMLAIDRQAPIVTGGKHADGFLITMRESPDADERRVTLCYADRDQLTVETTGTWDTLGMRGTASAGMRLRGQVPAHQVVGEPGGFRAVAAESMIPAGHLGWSAVWLGAARAVLSDVLTMMRAQGTDKVPDLTADRLARARIDVELVASYLAAVRDEVRAHRRAGTSLSAMPTQIHLNNLKVAASELTFRAVDGLMQVAGLTKGYRRDSPIPVERVFRDLRSAALNYSNDRITTATGTLSLLDRVVTLAPADLM